MKKCGGDACSTGTADGGDNRVAACSWFQNGHWSRFIEIRDQKIETKICAVNSDELLTWRYFDLMQVRLILLLLQAKDQE